MREAIRTAVAEDLTRVDRCAVALSGGLDSPTVAAIAAEELVGAGPRRICATQPWQHIALRSIPRVVPLRPCMMVAPPRRPFSGCARLREMERRHRPAGRSPTIGLLPPRSGPAWWDWIRKLADSGKADGLGLRR